MNMLAPSRGSVLARVLGLLAVLAGLVMAPLVAGAQPALDPTRTYRVPIDDAPVRGPRDAPITIVEMSDFGCPYCGRAQQILADLERLYPGQIRLVYRQNPLDPEDGTLAAEASLAAREQGAFWRMHDRIFAAGGVVTRTMLDGFASELGLDLARFRRDLDERRMRPTVLAESALAHALGAFATPVFFVNGRPIKGARALGVFVRIIEEERVRTGRLLARGVAPKEIYDTIMASVPATTRTPDAGTSNADDDHGFSGLEDTQLVRVGFGLPGHSIGPDSAPVTIVVFTDFECPYCSRLAPSLTAMHSEHPGAVRIVIRHMPLAMHRHAELAAEAVVAAAAQGKMWAMHERLFAPGQDPRGTPDSAPERRRRQLGRSDLEHHAMAIGLDMDKFRAALDERKYLNAVLADAALGRALGITGTPTLFFNGVPVQGVAPYQYLRDTYVEPALAAARELVASGVKEDAVYEKLTANADAREVGSKGQRYDIAAKPDHFDQDVLISVHRACRTRNAGQASLLYRVLSRPGEQRRARATCEVYGIDPSVAPVE